MSKKCGYFGIPLVSDMGFKELPNKEWV